MEHFFPRIQVKTKKKVFTKNGSRRVARNSQMGGGLIFGFGGGASSRRRPMGAGGFSPSRRRRSKILHFFAKIA